MKYLNLGCGNHYSKEEIWTNLDFISTGEGVIAHNLLNGIPYPDNTFDVVYHSHLLEHFSKADGAKLLKECHRVLKPGGILRIAIPDLEQIVRGYLHFLEKGVENPTDEGVRANYNWMLIELYDQAVRNVSGGEMEKYLCQNEIINEEFVFQRIGEEGKAIRESFLCGPQNTNNKRRKLSSSVKALIKKIVRPSLLKSRSVYESTGRFRLGGEIHQWMYDRYSLSHLLNLLQFEQIILRDAFTSYIPDWAKYELDGKHGSVRKPDSLFIEAVRH